MQLQKQVGFLSHCGNFRYIINMNDNPIYFYKVKNCFLEHSAMLLHMLIIKHAVVLRQHQFNK